MTRVEERPATVELRVLCRRLEVTRTLEEHRGCPYCFGGDEEVLTGDWKCFCDFEPGVDPICFGFPPGTTRLLRG